MTVNSAGQLTNSTPTGLAAALRHRARADGVDIEILASRPDPAWKYSPAGSVYVSHGQRAAADQAAWVRASVAPDVLREFPVRAGGLATSSTSGAYRVFGTAGDYLLAAAAGDRDAALPCPASTGDWAHWRTTVSPEVAAAVEAVAPSLAGYDGAPEDLLSAFTALFSLPAAVAAEALAPTV